MLFTGMGGLFVYMLLTDPSSVTVNDRPGTKDDVWFAGIFVLIGLGIAGIRYQSHSIKIMHDNCPCRTAWLGPFVGKRDDTDAAAFAVIATGLSEHGNTRRSVYPLWARQMMGMLKYRRQILKRWLVGMEVAEMWGVPLAETSQDIARNDSQMLCRPTH